MKLVLWLIVAANCHFINGSSVGGRVGRAAADPVVEFNKLTAEENKQRRRECGKIANKDTDLPPLTHFPLAGAAPWLVNIDKPETDGYTNMVVISRRHMLADRHALRNLNMRRLFGDYANKPAQVLSSSLEESDMEVFGRYCEKNDWKNCKQKLWSAHPSKVIIDNSRNPEIVLFAFDDYIPMTPVCLPYMKLTKGDEVLVQSLVVGTDELSRYSKLFDVRPNGLAVHNSTVTLRRPLELRRISQVLVKKELGRFTIVGNSNRWEGNLELFSSVLPFTERICKWTGACPSLPHVDFKGISKEENVQRYQTCGKRTKGSKVPELSDAVKLSLEAPWLVHVKRSGGVVSFDGIIISQRHIIANPIVLFFFVHGKFRENVDSVTSSIHSTGNPVITERGEAVTFEVTISVCADDKCQSRKNKTLTPERVMLVFGNYVLLEMGEDMGVLPACLPNDMAFPMFDKVSAVLKNGTTIRYRRNHDHERKETNMTFNPIEIWAPTEAKKLLSNISERFPETLLDPLNTVFTVFGMNKDEDRKYAETVSFRHWNEEHEHICKATGICSSRMVLLKLGEHETGKLWNDENTERLRTCGTLSNTSQAVFNDNDAPWLVGIRQNSSSPVIHTGVLISPRHVLMPGSMFAGEEDLSELFGINYKNQQPRHMSVALPEYDLKEFKFNFEVLMRQCVDYNCSSRTEKVHKPSRLILSDSSEPSMFIFLFDDNLPNVPVCLESQNRAYKGDELFIQQYTDPEATVLSVTNASILARMEPFDTKYGILVRKDGNRTVLVGNRPLVGFSNSSNWFTSTFSLRYEICELIGVCHPYY